MPEPTEELLQRSLERLGVFSRAAFGVGLSLSRTDGREPAFPSPPREIGSGGAYRRLLLADEATPQTGAPGQERLLDDFLDMAAGLLGTLAEARYAAAVEPLREQLWRDLLGAPTIVGVSPAACALRTALPTAANSRESLFIAGEPGSGRRSLAAAVHRAGPRAAEPFIAENLALVPPTLQESGLFGSGKAPGLIGLAAKGTLYISGLEQLSPGAQVRLVSLLVENAEAAGTGVAPRIISSAEVDLEQAVRRGRLRNDLVGHLTTLRLAVAPLRERPEDIPLIATHLLRRHTAMLGANPPAIAPEALEALKRHPWAGNVRALDEELMRAGAGRTEIRAEDLRESIAGGGRRSDAAPSSSLRQAVSELEMGLIARALEETNWNKSRAARVLGLSRLGLQKKIDRYGIDRRR